MTATIFDIQRNSYVDGPGIRTTVFFKGCNLRCAWCHNPESQSAAPQLMFYQDKCSGCGKCKEICPASDQTGCLSALTQKKGVLSDAEAAALLSHPLVWGCDLCQEVCPHAKNALQRESALSPIPYFSEDTLSHLTPKLLDAMSDEAFGQRAYSWRGKETILRNLRLQSAQSDKNE